MDNTPRVGLRHDALVRRLVFNLLVGIESDDCVEWPYGRNADGYGRLMMNGRRLNLHVVACREAHGEPPPGREMVLHACDNPPCINPRHLRWGSAKQNGEDMADRDRSPRGRRNGMAKLSDDDVACLRRRREQGELLRELAVEFGVTMATISKIARRDRWMHIS